MHTVALYGAAPPWINPPPLNTVIHNTDRSNLCGCRHSIFDAGMLQLTVLTTFTLRVAKVMIRGLMENVNKGGQILRQVMRYPVLWGYQRLPESLRCL